MEAFLRHGDTRLAPCYQCHIERISISWRARMLCFWPWTVPGPSPVHHEDSPPKPPPQQPPSPPSPNLTAGRSIFAACPNTYCNLFGYEIAPKQIRSKHNWLTAMREATSSNGLVISAGEQRAAKHARTTPRPVPPNLLRTHCQVHYDLRKSLTLIRDLRPFATGTHVCKEPLCLPRGSDLSSGVKTQLTFPVFLDYVRQNKSL